MTRGMVAARAGGLAGAAAVLAVLLWLPPARARDLATVQVAALASMAAYGGGVGECVGCHRIEPEMSHPLGMTGRGEVLTCLSCHDGGRAAGHERTRARGEAYLRPEAGACSNCHGTESPHAISGRAHLLPGGPRSDTETRGCITCHDGAMAMDALAHGELVKDHPVGVAQASRRDGPALVPAWRVDARVRLFEGAVGCGSCHSVYSRERSLLVMSNDRSQLCLSCHAE